tara:strand:+ start:30495 stop:31379 length:885 start_codon:yes stop_codon:yes gene_type:complete
LSLFSEAKIQMAITVDDLPAHGQLPGGYNRLQITKKMLDVLKSHQIPEVYGFLNASKIGDDKILMESVKLWTDTGYPLGNHTFTHKSINKVSLAEFKQEIDNNESALQNYGGKFDWKYFRYPYLHEGNTLETRNAIRDHLKSKGYKIAQVTVDFEDWSWNDPYARCLDKNEKKTIKWLKSTFIANAKEHLRREVKLSKFLFQRPVKHILLLHVGAFDADMMDELLLMYKKEGVEFIPLSEAISDEIYTIDPALAAEHGSELTFQILKSKNLKLKDAGLKKFSMYPKEKLDKVCR